MWFFMDKHYFEHFNDEEATFNGLVPDDEQYAIICKVSETYYYVPIIVDTIHDAMSITAYLNGGESLKPATSTRHFTFVN